MEADQWAKTYLDTAKEQLRCYNVPYEPWSVWYKGKKLMNLSQNIYNLVHGQKAIFSWEKKE